MSDDERTFGFDDSLELYSDPGWIRKLIRDVPRFEGLYQALKPAVLKAKLGTVVVRYGEQEEHRQGNKKVTDRPIEASFEVLLPVSDRRYGKKTVRWFDVRERVGHKMYRVRTTAGEIRPPGLTDALPNIDPGLQALGNLQHLGNCLRRALQPECADMAARLRAEVQGILDNKRFDALFYEFVEKSVRDAFHKAVKPFRHLPHELLHRLLDEAEVQEVIDS